MGYKSVEIIYCRTEEFAKEMMDFYTGKGYSIGMSTVEIETGTHGKHIVKKLDILSR